MILSSDEFPGGPHLEPAMGMDFVVILDPSIDEAERGLRVRQGVDTNVVAFEGLHERFRHTIRFRTPHRREAAFRFSAAAKSRVSLAV